MLRRADRCSRLWITASLALFVVVQARAGRIDDAAPQDLDDQVRRLEAKVEQQQARLETLHDEADSVAADQRSARDAQVRQLVEELLDDAAFRDGLMPASQIVGYNKGFYIKSSDKRFLLKINGFTKIRWTGANRQTDNPRRQGRQPRDDINGFEIEDMRLIFGGYLYDPRLTYKLVITGDTDQQGGQWRTQIAWIDYKVAEELQFVAGLIRPPFGRQQLVSRPFFQFPDRSIANEVFTRNRTILAGVHGMLAKKLSYSMAVANGFSNPHDGCRLDQLDTNFAYVGRLVAHILGKPIRTESDLAYSKDPQLEFGASFAYNDDNGDRRPSAAYAVPDRIRRGRGVGGYGLADLSGTAYYQFGADAAFRYRGLSVTSEYFLQTIDSETPFSAWALATGRDDAMHQQGGYVQAGYFLVPRLFEVAGRLGGVWDFGNEGSWEYAVGVNYFPWKTYSVVLMLDYTHIDEAPSTSTHANWGQNDEIDMVRMQLMIKF